MRSMRMTLASKLTYLLLFAGLLPLIISFYLNYKSAVEMMTEEIETNLKAFVETKANHINTYFDERRKDVESLAHSPVIIDAAPKLIAAFKTNGTEFSKYASLDREIRLFLTYYIETYDYYDLLVISSGGDIVFSMMHEKDFGTNLKTGPYKDSELAKSFIGAATLLETSVSDFRYYEPSQEPDAFIATPIYREGVTIGVLAAQINANTIYELVQDYTGLGKTGETIIASRIGDRAVFLNPLRHDPDAAFKREVVFGSDQGLPIQQAVQGRKGTGIFEDYRGEETLAAWRYLPHLRMGMVVKQDTSEAFALIYLLRNRLFVVGSVALLALICAALLFSRTISAPIKSLTRTTELMARGDMSARADIRAGDEIGVLGTAFNEMAEKLQRQTDSLERMVEERTEKLEMALNDSQDARDKIDGIIKSIADGIIVTDSQKKIVLMNRAAEELLDVRLSSAIGLSLDFAVRDKSLQEKLTYTFDKKMTGYEFDFEHPGKDPKNPRIMRARTSLLGEPDGTKVGTILVIQDVTHEREIDRMKTEFLITAAHELRTPLTSIQGFSEILMTRDNINIDERKKYLGYINKQSIALGKIVTDLLDVSRIESRNGMTIRKTKSDIREVIKEVVFFFEEQKIKNKLKIEIPQKPLEFSFDPEKIDRVLKNLISNAVKYSPGGGEIRIALTAKENACQISIEDQGIGMTSEQVTKIFDKFYRADTSDSAPDGTGLGMTIAKHLVESHGGTINVESESKKSTKVTITLPLLNTSGS